MINMEPEPDGLGRPVGRAQVQLHTPTDPPLAEQLGGKVVTVFSAKGGCGTSTVATNLAVALAQRGSGRVCLLDFDLAAGDVAIMLQLTPQRTVADAIAVADRIDEIGFRALLTTYRPGLEVLLAPVRPALAEQVSKDLISELIHLARGSFDYVVIDTAVGFTEQMLAVLDATHQYVLVTTPELPALKNLRVALDMFELLDYRREARTVVLNRADARAGLSMTEIEKAIRVPITGFVPSSKDVAVSANHGTPLAVSHPNHPVSAAIRDFAAKSISGGQPKQHRRGLFKMRWE